MDDGFGLFTNSDCRDLFANVKINGKPMYNNRNIAVQLRFKFNQQIISEEVLKLKFMMGIGGLNDLFYIMTILRRKRLIRKKFVLELEQGQEVFIPNELSVDMYPQSFWYYDPLI